MRKNIFLIMLVLNLGNFVAVFAMEEMEGPIARQYSRGDLLALRGNGSPLPLEAIEAMKANGIFGEGTIDQFCVCFIAKYFGVFDSTRLELFKLKMKEFLNARKWEDLCKNKRLRLFGLRRIVKCVFWEEVRYRSFDIFKIFFVLVVDLVEFIESKYKLECKNLRRVRNIHDPKCVLYFRRSVH